MSTPREGQRVAFVGYPTEALGVGDTGKVLSSDGNSCHVMWATGRAAGTATLVDGLDVVASGAKPRSYDDLESGSLVTVAVRDVYDGSGPVALLNALNDEGHLASLTSIAEDVLASVSASLREDPSFREVLAQLDPDDGAEFVQFTATALLRDAFGGGEDA